MSKMALPHRPKDHKICLPAASLHPEIVINIALEPIRFAGLAGRFSTTAVRFSYPRKPQKTFLPDTRALSGASCKKSHDGETHHGQITDLVSGDWGRRKDSAWLSSYTNSKIPVEESGSYQRGGVAHPNHSSNAAKWTGMAGRALPEYFAASESEFV